MRPSRKLLIALLSPFAGLFLAEGLVRVMEGEAIPQPVARGILFQVSKTPGLTFENRPGATRRIEYRASIRAEPRVVEHRVNQQGLRGPLVDSEGTRDYRILCLGDSHTFGAGVGEGETWPDVLRDLSNEEARRVKADSGPIEVLNAGVNAYDTRREVILLRDALPSFEPDMVLLQYHVNDVHARNGIGFKPGFDDWLWKLSAPDREDWIGDLRRKSKLADLLLDRVRSARGARDESGVTMVGYSDGDEGWLAVSGALIEARDLLRERDVEFAVLLFPSLLQHGKDLSSHRAFHQVAEFCRANGIKVYDAEPELIEAARGQGRSIDELRVHPHDPHAGPQAHAAFATGVLRWMRESHMGPSFLRPPATSLRSP